VENRKVLNMKKANQLFKLHKLFSPILIIIFAVVMRLLPHPPNVAPIAAMALFGGVYLNKKYALIVPLIAMFISDIFLGFYPEIIFVYSSFFLIGLIGLWLRNHKTFQNVIFASFISSILFFLITNFGVWLIGTMYDKSLSGLYEAYLMGLPFFRNTLIGDLGYVGLFFGSYEYILFVVSTRKVQIAEFGVKSEDN
jgi:uncharacterized membrane protein